MGQGKVGTGLQAVQWEQVALKSDVLDRRGEGRSKKK
jgi:hypothetical protein